MLESRDTAIEKALKEIEEYYKSQGMAQELGFGKKPALLVIDFQQGITNPHEAAGCQLAHEMESTLKVLKVFRKRELPIFYFVIAFHDPQLDGRLITKKVPALARFTLDSDNCSVDPRVAPQPGEPVLVKKHFSCFHGTPLGSTLHGLEVDTVIITGCITSSCIRATAIDAIQYGFRPIIPRECVGDRSSIPHMVNLMDINARCGDVVSLKEVVDYVKSL